MEVDYLTRDEMKCMKQDISIIKEINNQEAQEYSLFFVKPV